MRVRELGDSGVSVSVVGVGCNNFGVRIDEAATKAVVDAAIDAGITFFDTADSYGTGASETLLGRSVKGRREQVAIATKFGWWKDPANTGALGRRAHVRGALEASLRRLGTDYVDLYQYHRPDRVTPLAETLGAMSELVCEGRVRCIGATRLTAAEVAEAVALARDGGLARFVSVQNEYSWLARDAERDVLPECERNGVAFIPYFPLANGLLTGKYARAARAPAGTRLATGDQLSAISDETWDRLKALTDFAGRHDVGLLQVAIGGLAAVPAVVSVIAGASTPEQVRGNATAGEWEPTDEQMHELHGL
jgi:aryl-alcohol dehydrogenase-like predicted oxidoreductase